MRVPRKSAIQKQQEHRVYMRKNRNTWSILGIKTMTMRVPEVYKDQINCVVEMMRAEYLVELAESPATSEEQMEVIASRNMPKGGSTRYAEMWTEALKVTSVGREAEALLEKFTFFEAKRRIALKHSGADDPEVTWIWRAKAIAYAHVMKAAFNYLELLYRDEQRKEKNAKLAEEASKEVERTLDEEGEEGIWRLE